MALLRLQICVQPREVPSSLAHGPPEPTHKWLQVCPDDLTIQALAEQLEARFHARSHTLLNIKILKFLDDLELDPSQKVGEIFDDIRAGDRFSTVKVYRNPPTPAELVDNRRFESLPPDSAARPRKRPLPPLFSEATSNAHFSAASGPTWQPVQATDGLNEPNKRQNIQNIDTDADRPLLSREVEHRHGNASLVARRGQSQVDRVNENRIPSYKKRSNPYGTPLSAQISSQDQHGSEEERIISVPDSPDDNGASQPLEGSVRAKSESPEIPSSVYDHPQSQSLIPNSSYIQTTADHRFVNRTIEADGQTILATPMAKPLSLQANNSDRRRSEPQPDHPTARTTPPNHGSSSDKPGRLKRPGAITAPTPFKTTDKSVVDPIETSEESSQEPYKLSSHKRPKLDYINKGSLEVTSTKKSPEQPPQAPADSVAAIGEDLNADKLATRESLSARKHLGDITSMLGSAEQQDADVSLRDASRRYDPLETRPEPKLSSVNALPTDQRSPLCIISNGDHAKGAPDSEFGKGTMVNNYMESRAAKSNFSPLEPLGDLHMHQREEEKQRAIAELNLIAKSGEHKRKKQTGAAQSLGNDAAIQQHTQSSMTADNEVRRREGQKIEEDRLYNLRNFAPAMKQELKDILSEGHAQKQATKGEKAEEEAARKQQKRKEEQQLRKQTSDAESARTTRARKSDEQKLAEERKVRLAEETERMEHERQAEEKAAKAAEAEDVRRREEERIREAKEAEQRRIEAEKDAREKKKQQELKAKEDARQAQERDAKKRRDEANARRKAKAEASEKLEKEKEQQRELERIAEEEKVRKEKERLAQEENSRVEKEKAVSSQRATLTERKLKARINAERQLKLADEQMKRNKLDSFLAGTSKLKNVSTPNKKPQRRESKGPKKAVPEQGQVVEKSKIPFKSYADVGALRAAGIISTPPTPSPQEKPATARKDDGQIRSFTPIMPSLSVKSKKSSEASQTPTAHSYLTKTPIRSALRSNVVGSQRSVSFADDKPSKSQPSNPSAALKSTHLKQSEIVLSSGSEVSTVYSGETESSASGTASDSKQANEQLQRESFQANARPLRPANAPYPTLSSLREAQSTRLEGNSAPRAEPESSSDSDSDSGSSSSSSEDTTGAANGGTGIQKNPFKKMFYTPKR